VTDALLAAEEDRLRELGMQDLLVTPYYFQDAQLLRELALPASDGVRDYCARRASWFEQFREKCLDVPEDEVLAKGAEFTTVLREIRQLMERNLRHHRDHEAHETIKVELYARDPEARSLFLLASSESHLLDPRRSRRFPLTRDDERAAAAVKAFTTGKPGLVEKLRTHEHGRWNGFWATPVMLGAPPWYGLPVGALVISTTRELNETSLRSTIPVVQKELSRLIAQCAAMLDFEDTEAAA
jgi:hypothetical protein